MSILDTFFLLFEADTTDLDAGLEKARKKGKDTADDLRTVDAVAHKLGGTLKTQLAQLGGALLGAVAFSAMAQGIQNATEHADKLYAASKRLRMGVEDLSAWGDLVTKEGGSVDGFTGSIEAFNKQLVQMEATGKSRAAPFLKELGIDLEAAANKGKTALDFLPQLADAFQGMNADKAQALGSRLGLDQATIMVLQSGRREVEAMIAKEKELGVVTKEAGEAADAFGDQMDDTKHAFRSMWQEVATAVLPALTWVMAKFQQVAQFMRKHSDFIIGLMIAIGAAVLFFVVPPLLKAGAAALVAFAPFLLLGAVVAGLAIAFALLYEDVQAFMAGNDSLIGQILQKWPVVGDMAKALVGWLRFLWDTAAALLQFLVTMWTDPAAAWDAFAANMVDGVERLLSMFPALGETAAQVAEVIRAGMAVAGAAFDVVAGKVMAGASAVGEAWATAAGLVRQAWDAMVAAVSAAIEAVMGAIGTVAGAFGKVRSALGFSAPAQVAQGVEAGRSQLATAAASPVGSVTSSAISNTATRGGDKNVTVGQVTVQTQATDGPGIARSIGGALGSQLRAASSQFDDGVAA